MLVNTDTYGSKFFVVSLGDLLARVKAAEALAEDLRREEERETPPVFTFAWKTGEA